MFQRTSHFWKAVSKTILSFTISPKTRKTGSEHNRSLFHHIFERRKTVNITKAQLTG
jgi:hypothetical protein